MATRRASDSDGDGDGDRPVRSALTDGTAVARMSLHCWCSARCPPAGAAPSVRVDDDGDQSPPRRGATNTGGHGATWHQLELRLGRSATGTPLSLSGCQLWPGAVLAAQYMLMRPDHFHGKVVLELGAGVGLTALAAAHVGAQVCATDNSASSLSQLRANVTSNWPAIAAAGSVSAALFDWASTGDQWPVEVRHAADAAHWLVAADCVYDCEMNLLLFDLLERILERNERCSVLIALERRINFDVESLRARCAPAEHLHAWLHAGRFHVTDALPDVATGRFALPVAGCHFADMEMWIIRRKRFGIM